MSHPEFGADCQRDINISQSGKGEIPRMRSEDIMKIVVLSLLLTGIGLLFLGPTMLLKSSKVAKNNGNR